MDGVGLTDSEALCWSCGSMHITVIDVSPYWVLPFSWWRRRRRLVVRVGRTNWAILERPRRLLFSVRRRVLSRPVSFATWYGVDLRIAYWYVFVGLER